ncbi:MAG: hypothetical protein LBE70_01660 [Nitrososphaerota archaeon]|jgi:hypothetical protein|nr:hypothetical protein [Nitrososphaerota archaeon]
MPIPQALVTRYFQLIVNKQYAEAERELERVKQKLQKTEWNRGYFRALYGMYLSRKNANDTHAFFSKLDLSDKVSLHTYRREFLDNMRSGLHGDFDRGYFSAWGDCMRILTRMDIPAPANPTSSKTQADTDAETETEVGEEVIETVRSDKSQVTIANFFKGDKKMPAKTKKQASSAEPVVTAEDVAKKE